MHAFVIADPKNEGMERSRTGGHDAIRKSSGTKYCSRQSVGLQGLRR
jgi:hypothetical protein